MSDRVRIVGALALAALLWVACDRPGSVRRVARPEGDILTVKGQYTLVVLSQDIMRQTFGSEWHRLSLFYAADRAITQDGKRAMIHPPLRPLAKGSPILVISGDDWPDLLVAVYALEDRKQTLFSIDTVGGVIKVLPSPGPRPGVPTLSPDGSLFFR